MGVCVFLYTGAALAIFLIWRELPEYLPGLIAASVVIGLWSIVSYVRALRLYISGDQKFYETIVGESAKQFCEENRYNGGIFAKSIPSALLLDVLLGCCPVVNVVAVVINFAAALCEFLLSGPEKVIAWYGYAVENMRAKRLDEEHK